MSTVMVEIARRRELAAPMVEQAKKVFNDAAKAFAKNPSGDNWSSLRVAMFVYQQAVQIRNSAMTAHLLPEFMERWKAMPDTLRGELIVRHSTGKSIGDYIDIYK